MFLECAVGGFATHSDGSSDAVTTPCIALEIRNLGQRRVNNVVLARHGETKVCTVVLLDAMPLLIPQVKG